MLNSKSDEQVAEEALTGDPEAFGELVRRWEARIFRVAYGMLGSAEDARDATQDAFLLAYRHLHKFRGEARVSSWLHRITINVCISRRRRAAVRPEAEMPENIELNTDDDFCFMGSNRSTAGNFHASPAATTEQAERAAAVRRALATLPPELREVVVLKEFEELTFQQIAERMELPLSTVKSRLYTALKQLRAKLSRFEAKIAVG